MTILEKIAQHKKKEVAEKKALYPIKLLEKSIYFSSECVSLKKYVLRKDKSGIIAEFKRKSPSKGMINQYADVEKISIGYMQSGASALSILTDSEFFGGQNKDLTIARKFNFCPILRKDFIISEYQIIEAKSIGADAILLIAAILSKEDVIRFTDFAHQLNMEVLLEIHDESELNHYYEAVDLVGINNRNLHTFEVDLEVAINLAKKLPPLSIKIAESGISSPNDLLLLKKNGFDGFLIGEHFMKNASPQRSCQEFIQNIITLQQCS